MKFEDLPIDSRIKKAISDLGFLELTPIQEKAILPSLEGRDITGLAQTGTGKTIAFLIPIVHRILTDDSKHPRALILAPTRELVIQIAEEAKKLLKYSESNVATIIGGANYKEQEKELKDASIIVATPGRLLDHIKNEKIDLSGIEFFVLDEADRMFDMGFIKDVRFLMKKCHSNKQTFLYSATLSYYVVRLAADYLNDPVEIQIEPEKVTTENIDQKLIHLGREEKIPYLVNLILNEESEGLGIIFTNLKVMVSEIVINLRNYGIAATGISSLLDQKKRIRLLKDFKLGKYRYMVATDVASRGIDIDNINSVYNFDLPSDSENYVHRIGRTARAGRKGTSISFCSERDYTELEKIETLIGRKIAMLQVREDYLNFPKGEYKKFIMENEKEFSKNNEFQNSRNGKKSTHKHGNKKGKGRFQDKKGKQEYKKKIGGDDRPYSNLEEAENYLKKADSVIGEMGKTNVKITKPKGHRSKFEHKPKHHSSRTTEKKTHYDKSKRNLFDINDESNSVKKKPNTIWKKIKSVFGF
ncbi:MAG: DEAD/DEAH box helicase [Leptospiraceae bacterium]|nr:DEAD/DEAH box helicase [Leptospiraceae bacterium]MCK6382010.1 DEAD/DEAH box helicase [Leptospiraceae bacterium]NUM40381.1 DEAD/DEAH box helicase [Leptospiraceae bacterium]